MCLPLISFHNFNNSSMSIPAFNQIHCFACLHNYNYRMAKTTKWLNAILDYRTRRNFRGVLYFADFRGQVWSTKNYYALLYFITHEIFKIRTKTKKPRKFITSKITMHTVYEEGEVDHINGVWPVFPLKYSYLMLIIMMPLPGKCAIWSESKRE